jgi:hypothetical protein
MLRVNQALIAISVKKLASGAGFFMFCGVAGANLAAPGFETADLKTAKAYLDSWVSR